MPSIELSGFITASLFLTPLADSYGRLKFIYLQIFLGITGFTIYIFTSYIYLYFIAAYLNGLSIGLKCFILYAWLIEMFPGKEAMCTSLLFFTDGLIFVVSPILLEYVMKNTYNFIYLSLFIAITAFTLFRIFKIQESLKWMLSKNQFT